jgi:Na+/H+ antiporter NhaD/arsenite permease-like protein
MQPTELLTGVAPHAVRDILWGVPFAGMLGSIALFPMVAPRFWHRRMAAVSIGWVLVLLVQEALVIGPRAAASEAWQAVLGQYLPFVTLLLALYTAGGGILLRGGLRGTPIGNTAMLAVATLLGGLMGTIGAAMVLIHPLLSANAHRRRKVHLVVFFTLLAANAGGALSPLGPPLYIGLLQGVPFFWPLRQLGLPLAVLVALLLGAFFLLDRHLARGEPQAAPAGPPRLRGWVNVVLVAVVVVNVVVQSLFQLGDVRLAGAAIETTRLAGIGLCLAVAALSAAITPRAVRQGNDFSWDPMQEVAVLFIAIFITIAPVIGMLEAGLAGPLAPLLRLTMDGTGAKLPMAFFWLAGFLSAFLDNAPTYLVFFKLAGNNPVSQEPTVLRALSAGAVFFGGLTYIGNAPNLMLRAIASHRGVRMPGFFTFSLYAAAALLPAFVLLSLLFFA